ncbi:MAG: ABC transporter permease subunit [Hyphomonadaceae bacterium]|nr:ABC transporter permease subunit [Hyphomonadaceae bacterium]
MTAFYPPRPAKQRPLAAIEIALNVGPPVLLGAALAALYAWARSGLEEHRRFLMPGWSDLWTGAFASEPVRAELFRAAGVTAQIALTGLAITIPIGMLLGVLMFRWRFAERAAFPYLVALQSIPILAIIPLIQSLLGFGFVPKVLIVALFTFFAIPTTLLLGLKSLDPGIIDLFRLQGASWRTTLLKAGLPASLPALFAGLRISAGLAVIGAIVSELFFVSGDGGLGQMLINTKIDFQYEQMYAALIVSSAMSIGVYLFFSWLGRRLFSSWHDAGEA